MQVPTWMCNVSSIDYSILQRHPNHRVPCIPESRSTCPGRHRHCGIDRNEVMGARSGDETAMISGRNYGQSIHCVLCRWPPWSASPTSADAYARLVDTILIKVHGSRSFDFSPRICISYSKSSNLTCRQLMTCHRRFRWTRFFAVDIVD